MVLFKITKVFKCLINVFFLFGFVSSAYAIDLSGNSDGNICSWILEVKSTPIEYFQEAKKRNLPCALPSNSRKTSNGWECYSGFRNTGQSCIKINAPQNAYISGNSWYCKTGFTKRENSCIPLNAYKYSNHWRCNEGYIKSGNSCRKRNIPENSYAVGDSWSCNTGYKFNPDFVNGNGCIIDSTPKLSVKKAKNFKNSNLILSWFFNKNGPTLWSWLVFIFVIFLIRSNNKSNNLPKKVTVANGTPKSYPKKSTKPVLASKPKSAPVAKPKAKAPPRKIVVEEKLITPTSKPKPIVVAKPSKKPIIITNIKSNVRIEETSLGFNVLHFEQGSKEWLEWRHTGIGASDASTVMGDNRFESPEELLYAKKNKIIEPPNEAMKKGTRLEPIARDLYIEKTGIKVIPLCLQDKKDPWIIASMDGITKDFTHIVEIKCGQSAYWQANKGIVPDYYYGQLQHQMMITGLKEVDYWCYWPDQKPILQNVKRDETYIKSMYKREKEFIRKLYE